MKESFEIITTIGPSCCDENTINDLIEEGATSLRLNLSHLDAKSLNRYQKLFKNASILPSIDTQGAQIRITRLKDNNIQCWEGQEITITSESCFEVHKHDMSINHSEAFEQLQTGDVLKIDFDGVTAQIRSIDYKNLIIIANIISAGTITKNRAIDIDQKIIKLNAFTKFDIDVLSRQDLSLYQDIYISYCNKKEDVVQAKELTKQQVNPNLQRKYIAKIETIKGVQNLESILTEADAILVDRGDLSREIKISRIPIITSSILKTCQRMEKPCYIATNVLDSMILNSLPPRAEISDIYNLIDGRYSLGSRSSNWKASY